jgi:hypothetical protein
MDTTSPRTKPEPFLPSRELKALAIDASPHGGSGDTALILAPFLEGMKFAGADVDLGYTEDLTIRPCRGYFSCFCRPSGTCTLSDDMDWLMPKVRAADILVFALPLYVVGVTGPMKILIDRLVPLLQMYIETREGHSRQLPEDPGIRKLVLFSNCGFWEKDKFDPVICHMRALSKNLNAEFVGALVRPHGPVLRSAPQTGLPYQDILEGAQTAGRQVVTDGIIAEEVLETISREILSYESFMYVSRTMIGNLVERLGTERPAIP